MSAVGTFPGMTSSLRRTVRAPVNPMDKSTIVSIYPREINETKPTVTPSKFHLDAGNYENPAILVVGPSSWFKEVDEHQPLLEIPQGSTIIANSFVMDYCNGLLGSNMSTAMPGIFWVPGDHNVITVKTKFKAELDKAKTKQHAFWLALVNYADTFWARTSGSPLCISDDMRLAARELGFNDKDWMKDFSMLQKVNCPACGSPSNPAYPVCAVCKAIINPEKAKEMQIKFAQ
jgi:hypothetical protein